MIVKAFEDALVGTYSPEERADLNKQFSIILNEIMVKSQANQMSLVSIYEEKAAQDQKIMNGEESKVKEEFKLDLNLPDFHQIMENDIMLGNFATSQFESDEVAQAQRDIPPEEI